MKHEGLHKYRLKRDQGNPREVAFAKQWQIENDQGNILQYLLRADRQGDASSRDIEVAATVIQWLGSNVGMSFIEEVIKRSPEVKECIQFSLGRANPKSK